MHKWLTVDVARRSPWGRSVYMFSFSIARLNVQFLLVGLKVRTLVWINRGTCQLPSWRGGKKRKHKHSGGRAAKSNSRSKDTLCSHKTHTWEAVSVARHSRPFVMWDSSATPCGGASKAIGKQIRLKKRKMNNVGHYNLRIRRRT